VNEAVESVAHVVEIEIGATAGEKVKDAYVALVVKMGSLPILSSLPKVPKRPRLLVLLPKVVDGFLLVALPMAPISAARVEKMSSRIFGEHAVDEVLFVGKFMVCHG
jgi:hypothetical protein